MWDSMNCKTSLLGLYNPPSYGHMHPRMWGPYFQLGHGSDTIYYDPTPIM